MWSLIERLGKGMVDMEVVWQGKTESLCLTHGKTYKVLSIEKGWYRIIDDSGSDYLYPPDDFIEFFRENDNLNQIMIDRYRKLTSEERERLMSEKETRI